MRRSSLFALLLILCALQLSAQHMNSRTLAELINTQDPGWPLVQEWIKHAKNPVQVLPKTAARAEKVLLDAQVTTRSPMGAVVYETGGILVANGWLRILGSGSAALDRDLMGWNAGKQDNFLLVADDVLGGFFAINGGAFRAESIGKVYYFAPENLHWEPLNLSYSDFLVFCFSGNLDDFYQDMRWKGWKAEIEKLTGNQGISCVPFLFTKEGKDLNKVSRRPVSIEELWQLHKDMQQQLNGE